MRVLENMVASHLLKFTHYLRDAQGWKAELFYWWDIDGREIDFVVSVDGELWFAVEVKSSDKEIAAPLAYFKKKTGIKFAYQLVDKRGIDARKDGIRIMSVEKFLSGLV